MKESQNFTKGPLFLPLLKFALPVLAAHFLQTMYGAVDMLVVGQFAAPLDVSAISTGSWIMALLTCFVTGISVGTTVLLSRKIGEGKPEEAGKIIGASVDLFAFLSLVMTVALELFAPAIADVMQVPPEARAATITYIRICGAGSIFIVGFNVLGSIFRGIGNSTVPLMAVGIACAVNIAADLLFVAVFHMATAGAAIATVLAQLISVVLSLAFVARRDMGFSVRRADFSPNWDQIRAVLGLGFPVALQDVLVSISFLVITAIVNSLGVVVSAGVGVAEKLCGFVMLAPSSFSQTMTSIVSQNIGAEQPERAKWALVYGIASSLSVGIIMAYFSFFRGDLMSSVFSRDAAVIAVSAEYLKAYAIDTILVSFMFCMVGYFQGLGKTTFAMAQGIIGAFCVRIPVSYLMSRMEPVNVFHVGLATPASSLLQVILCVGFYLWLARREKKSGV